jgi:hypothetical protein
MDLLQFQQNLQSIDVWQILIPILEKHFGDIEELNRKQLSEGTRGDGSPMPDYKSESYADFKSKYIPTYSIYPTADLRYTGDFYAAIKAKLTLFGIEIESSDWKAQVLEQKYGQQINDLTEESMQIFIDLIIDEFRESLLTQMTKN